MKKAWIGFALVTALACGDDALPDIDASVDTGTTDAVSDVPAVDAPPAVCGDGMVGGAELCDTAIAAGSAGACPTECSPPGAGLCISVALSGTECMTQCAETPITEPANGDGCCPEGATLDDDDDCLALTCGDGEVGDDEVCDTAIPAGSAGACPTDCNDGVACTADTMTGAGTCNATCRSTPIEETANDDGCCPDGAVFADDNDCSPLCGNGTVDERETCDIAIAVGSAGACPRRCNDEMSCTADRLASARTCNAECVYTPITRPADGDMCCPSGATASTDTDCPSVCPNGIREPGEECDDGNDVDDDLCSNTCINNADTTAFRLDTIAIVDPEIYAAIGVICVGAKATANRQLQMTIDDYVLNAVIAFSPLDPMMSSTPVDVYIEADCDASGCTSGPQIESSTANNRTAGTCYTPRAGTRHAPYGVLNTAAAPCFSSATRRVTFNLAGSPVTLTNVTVAGTYADGQIDDGVLAGFITFESARATVVNLSAVGAGMPTLFSLLQSGLPGDACDTATSPMDDADDLDGDGTDDGWWFFLDVTATEVTFTP